MGAAIDFVFQNPHSFPSSCLDFQNAIHPDSNAWCLIRHQLSNSRDIKVAISWRYALSFARKFTQEEYFKLTLSVVEFVKGIY